MTTTTKPQEIIIIEIPKEEVEEYQALLELENVELEDEDSIIDCYSAMFEDGYFADIKICAGQHNYFIDPVLFDRGHEVMCLDCEGDLLGDYLFETEEKDYLVRLIEN